MKKTALKLTAIFFVLIFACTSVLPLAAFAADEAAIEQVTEDTAEENTEDTTGDNTEAPEPIAAALVLSSSSTSVVRNNTLQINATVSGVDTQPEIKWISSDSSIAEVDGKGLVKGKKIGKVTIYAKATVADQTIIGEYDIYVTAEKNFIRDFLVENQVLSYQYSYEDDYYYTNDKEAWQYNFGFGKIYDIVSPYVFLEYDYIRVFFTYENKDWMLQMWKGQYGFIFYGGEIGIYNRPHADDGLPEWTFFNCPAEEDWLNMEMTLWHEELNGTWTREFSREYGKYWWCTGFKNGHLRNVEPADELRLTGRITFKDEEMTKIVVEGLKACGFRNAPSKDKIGLDQIYVEGNDVNFCWQNISEAESTMTIKFIGGAMTVFNLLPVLPFIIPYVTMFGIAALLVSVIL